MRSKSLYMGGAVMRWNSLVIDSIGLRCLATTRSSVVTCAARHIRRIAMSVLALVFLLIAAAPAFAADFTEPANIFRKRCSACHTFGKGVKVGPDLKGVTDRRQRDWLLKFVRSSQTVFQSGDPTAKSLYDQFKPQKMPDWSDLSDKQNSAIMEYFTANGAER